jgi:hypothetical protein
MSEHEKRAHGSRPHSPDLRDVSLLHVPRTPRQQRYASIMGASGSTSTCRLMSEIYGDVPMRQHTSIVSPVALDYDKVCDLFTRLYESGKINDEELVILNSKNPQLAVKRNDLIHTLILEKKIDPGLYACM